MADFEGVKAEAEARVDVPRGVVDLIVDLRAYLQDSCEPPVYVSDRRLVKVRSISHWSPHDRVGVVNADP